MRRRVRGGVGGRRRAAHVRGEGPGQGGEDGLGPRPGLKTPPTDSVINNVTPDSLFLCFLVANFKLNRVNISAEEE